MVLENMDMTDRKILSELDKNARISYSELGKKIRVAKETVKYRIQNLEKKGIIQSYYATINLAKTGHIVYRNYIKLQNTHPKIEEKIIDYLIKNEKVAVFFRIQGHYDLAFGYITKKIWDYEKFWFEFKKIFGEYFADVHLSLFTEYIEFSRIYLLDKKSESKVEYTTLRIAEKEKLDKIDCKLLNIMSKNARESVVSIAKKLGVSIVTVRHHLNKLIKKKVIVGFRPVFNLQKLGRTYYKIDLWLRKFDNYEEIRGHILSQPEVTYSEKSIISSDIEFDIEAKNFSEFVSIMDSFKAKFPEDIRNYTYYSQVKNYKMRFAPEF